MKTPTLLSKKTALQTKKSSGFNNNWNLLWFMILNQWSEYLKAYNSRDDTIGAGFTLLKEHYDVHRFHPPLIYGRRGDADVGEGISLCRVFSYLQFISSFLYLFKGIAKKNGQKIYLLITYELPIISARAVPQQINFFNNHSKFFSKNFIVFYFLSWRIGSVQELIKW